ncbi:MAG TPA: ATP-binding cassette domain-containing protein, partial [Chryseolinea sp.]|nr:ATP-binding cassette domain-containing protein [Chryseolinea sp.]
MSTPSQGRPAPDDVTKAHEKHAGQITITINGLGKKFNSEWIFRNLSYVFYPGQIYAVTGPNGAGKSTLLQVLWGQMPQTIGKIEYKRNNKAVPVEDIFKHLSIATPYMELIEEFTLLEQMRFHFAMKSARPGMSEDVMLERMYLTDSKDKFISNFSSGMKQRVKLALAFFTMAD